MALSELMYYVIRSIKTSKIYTSAVVSKMSAWDGFDRTNRKPYGMMLSQSDPYMPPPPYVSQQGFPSHSQPPAPPTTSAHLRNPADKRNKEYVHRFAALGVGLASAISEHVLSHPFIVLRRQCQVHNTSSWNHLTPFTLFPTIFNIQRHQSMTTLWKGIGSALLVKGLAVASEATIHEFTPLPKEVTRHSSLKKMAEHILLKGLSFVIVTPFYAASLVETVQSEIACERPGVFDCIVEGVSRLVSFTSAQPTRLLPIWKLILPTVIYGVLHYVIASLAKYQVMMTLKSERLDRKGSQQETERADETMYEIYYPELAATFSGNLLADTLLYPLETVLYRLYLQGTRTIIDNTDTGLEVVPIITRYDGVVDCYVTIITEEGFAGLYKGFGALVLQYGLHMAILKLTRVVFDLLSKDGGTRKSSGHVKTHHAEPARDPRYDPARDPRYDPVRDPRYGRESYRGQERSGFT